MTYSYIVISHTYGVNEAILNVYLEINFNNDCVTLVTEGEQDSQRCTKTIERSVSVQRWPTRSQR